jgi:hypothetical protein
MNVEEIVAEEVRKLSATEQQQMATLVLCGYRFEFNPDWTNRGQQGNYFLAFAPDGQTIYMGQVRGNILPAQIEQALAHQRRQHALAHQRRQHEKVKAR